MLLLFRSLQLEVHTDDDEDEIPPPMLDEEVLKLAADHRDSIFSLDDLTWPMISLSCDCIHSLPHTPGKYSDRMQELNKEPF